jgi:catalase
MSAVGQDVIVRVVDTLNDLYGTHPGHRAAHAKGVYCQATFTATPEAAQISRAAHLRGDPVPALVRFSNGSGDPHSHDGAPDGRGMAVKFHRGTAVESDIVALTLPVFFARDVASFMEFTQARRPDPSTGQPDMAVFGAFLAAHPEAMPAIQAALAAKPPASFVQVPFHGIHTFHFTNQDGQSRSGRYRWIPEAGEAYLEPDDAKQRDADYLRSELVERLQQGSAAFGLDLVLSEDGDDVNDPTVAWPADRPSLRLGRLEITGVAEDPERDGDIVVFDPTHVVDGIELSDDEILHARREAYTESAKRRLQAIRA